MRWNNARTSPYIWPKIQSRFRVVLHLHSFISFLVSIPFSGPSLLETKFCINTFPCFLFFFGGEEGFLNQLSNRRQKSIYCAGDEHFWQWRWTRFSLEMNVFLAGDEHFSAWEECVEKTCSNLSHTRTHTHTASYQWLSNRTYSVGQNDC